MKSGAFQTPSGKRQQSHLFAAQTPTRKAKKGFKFWNQVLVGDCVKILENLPQNIKFDLVIADPPYNAGKDFGNNKDQMNLLEYVKWCETWIQLCLSRLKAKGILYIYGFPEILSHVAVRFPLQNQKWLVWHYTNKTVPSLKFWQRSHESILCLWKGKRPNLEIDQIREAYSPAYKNCIGKRRKGTRGRFGTRETVYKGHKNGALPRDVLKVSALAGGKGFVERSPLKHPTQKPLELSRKLIQSKINGSGGSLLIPFVGSGSECVSAKQIGIDFIGMEINPHYAKGANRWLSSHIN